MNPCLETYKFNLSRDVEGIGRCKGIIFFNTKGTKEGDVELSDSQKSFIRYVESGEVSDMLTKKLDEKVKEIRSDKKWRSAYMKTLTHDQDVYDSGYHSGYDSGVNAGIELGRTEGIEQQRRAYEILLAAKDEELNELKKKLAETGRE